jgi:predicted metalloprotease with PDZ domain
MRNRPSHGASARVAASLAAVLAAAVLAAHAPALGAQQPSASYADAFEAPRRRTDPAALYTVRVDAADPTGYAVALVLRRPDDAAARPDAWGDTLTLAFPRWAPGAYRLAEFGRYAQDVAATADGRPAAVTRRPDGRWLVDVRPGPAARTVPWRVLRITYRVRFPSAAAAATPNNRNFVRSDGTLLDGPLTYAYVAGQERLPAHVRLELPAGWQPVTGLEATADPRTFFARSYDVLVDSPVLAGPASALRVWRFAERGVPHRVAFWAQPGAPAFDTTAFVATARAAVRAALAVMGEAPYREYAFLYVDGSGGGLEHLNSTTIGARAASLARDPRAVAGVTAHEFWHLWNVKRLRPRELGPFDYQGVVRTPSLWWSEGTTDYFAAELLRRAGLRDSAAAVRDLASSLESYLDNPASARVSPERSSGTAWDPPAVNAGYSVSYYLQGKLLGELIELRLRSATGGRTGMDDVMRRLYDRFAGARGFAPTDVEAAVAATCADGAAPGRPSTAAARECGWVGPLFARHVRGAERPDWAGALALAGWRLDTTRVAAADSAGRPLPDLRVSVTPFAGIGSAGGAAGGRPRLSVAGPHVAAYRAGLRAGDEVVRLNGRAIDGPDAWRAATAALRVGDTLAVEVLRGAQPMRLVVALPGYSALRLRLVDAPSADAATAERQRTTRTVWWTGPGAPLSAGPADESTPR